ncbi:MULTISPECIES: sigma-54 interaction domain-containing protein [Microvirga]|uniref:sigma-54 interaction domain-containing protein n=1 Tax=Microvirga TaxID=186650 RepID=UPI001B35C9D9|nr:MULTISPECIES: sigma 54-interacting transcriptional regulator [unclassified Microvirga]MBQ0819327.1 sigma 54-interacting transcriptional regulator [Microvirga sp. HBU67558]
MALPNWLEASSEARFLRLVLDHVSDCLVVVDTSGRIVLINQPYCQLLGGDEVDFIGRHITDVVGSQTRLHLVARGEGTHVGYPLEVRGHKLVTKQVPVYQDGQIIGAVGMALFSDVEALKRTYSRMAQAGLAIHQRDQTWAAQFSLDDILGEGERIAAYRDTLRLAAEHEVPVLITGETGAGKELAAQAIHTLSHRSAGPFVWINCASIPSELIEAELFGYEGGAFTGARSRGKPGKFELAVGGTLLLDEIGDMPPHLQGSLLRVMQSNEIVRVGGTSPIRVDARIICATNQPLVRFVDGGRFRRDLYYRLDVLPVHVPALRERDDQPFLIEALLARVANQLGKKVQRPSPADMTRLLAHTWPGNVRELESVLLRFLVTGKIQLSGDTAHASPAVVAQSDAFLRKKVESQKLSEVEDALRKTGGDKQRAADLLGISRAQLYRIIKSTR